MRNSLGAAKRLHKELQHLEKASRYNDDDAEIYLRPTSSSSILHWTALIKGPIDTPYEDGVSVGAPFHYVWDEGVSSQCALSYRRRMSRYFEEGMVTCMGVAGSMPGGDGSVVGSRRRESLELWCGEYDKGRGPDGVLDDRGNVHRGKCIFYWVAKKL